MRNCLIKCLLTWLISLERSLTYPSVVVTNSNALRGPKTQKKQTKKKTKTSSRAGWEKRKKGRDGDGWKLENQPQTKGIPFFPLLILNWPNYPPSHADLTPICYTLSTDFLNFLP